MNARRFMAAPKAQTRNGSNFSGVVWKRPNEAHACPLWVKSGHVQCTSRMSAKCQ